MTYLCPILGHTWLDIRENLMLQTVERVCQTCGVRSYRGSDGTGELSDWAIGPSSSPQ